MGTTSNRKGSPTPLANRTSITPRTQKSDREKQEDPAQGSSFISPTPTHHPSPIIKTTNPIPYIPSSPHLYSHILENPTVEPSPTFSTYFPQPGDLPPLPHLPIVAGVPSWRCERSEPPPGHPCLLLACPPQLRLLHTGGGVPCMLKTESLNYTFPEFRFEQYPNPIPKHWKTF